MEVDTLIKQANQVYNDNWPQTTLFERAIFCSWSCEIGDCKFCYMSSQPKGSEDNSKKRRTQASILAEALLCRKYGWEIGFVTGGMHIWKHEELLELFKNIYAVYGEKFWISFGPLSKDQVIAYTPFAKGVVGSTETIEPKLHKKVCPSKPIEPYTKMFEYADSLGLKKAMTMIVGLGEKHEDFELLKEFITKYKIDKIHLYCLNPQKGTYFENAKSPSKEEQAWWISKTRISFPKIDIQLGIWLDKIERISYLLNSGANSISKFPITSAFGKKQAQEIEIEAKKANREFKGTLTKIIDIDWEKELAKIDIDEDLKKQVIEKVLQYERKMKRNVENS
jgi:biotin synthase-like enzyme